MSDARPSPSQRLATWSWDYFWADNQRRIQTVLGLLWLLDGGLQFQSFMYSRGFTRMLATAAVGQPGWLARSITWAARTANGDLAVWNTAFASIQVLLGLGLLYRPLVRQTLAASFAWALAVWWFGEAFAMLFMNMAQPLTGAPGAALLYVLVGLVAWPTAKPGGLLGARGARLMWAALWLMIACLWLTPANRGADATSAMLNGTPAGIGPIDSLQNHLASATRGDGLVIALVLAAASALIGVAVGAGWRSRLFLGLAIVLNLCYWFIPQGMGGIFDGDATDPNAAPLFMLLAWALFPVADA